MCVQFPMKVQLFSPAKINVFLSVLGPREDGFHEILSIACPLNFGDDVWIELVDENRGDGLVCNDPGVPLDDSNLMLKALELFRSRHPFAFGVRMELFKRIPMGGGMGGGSGNGAAVLWGVNELLGKPLVLNELKELAGSLGADCALFLEGGAVLMKGRGEIVEKLPEAASRKLNGKTVYLLLPGIPISTAWAYGRFKEFEGRAYDFSSIMEKRVNDFLLGELPTEQLLHNNFEIPVFQKYLALSVFREKLNLLVPGRVLLSGSGSSIFVLAPEDSSKELLGKQLKTLGEEAFGRDFELVKATTAPFESAPFVHITDSSSQ